MIHAGRSAAPGWLVIISSIAVIAFPGRGQADNGPVRVNRHGEAGFIELPRATSIGAGRYAFGVWANYFYMDGEQALRASPVSFSLGMPFRLDAAFSFTHVASEDPASRERTIQLHSSIKWQVLSQRKYPFDLALGVRLENLFSLPDISIMLLMVERRFDDLVIAAVAGGRIATSSDDNSESAVTFGAGAEYPVKPWLILSAEAVGRASPGGGSRVAFIAGGRLNLYKGLSLVLGLSGGILEEASFRASLGILYRPEAGHLEDQDGDGIPDVKDDCPEEAEDLDGYQDADGCPDLDNDGDGINDSVDPTPDGTPTGLAGLHKGDVRMRLAIPEMPIPTWIMSRRASPAESARLDQDREAASVVVRDLSLEKIGTTIGLSIHIRFPGWMFPSNLRDLGGTVNAPVLLVFPGWSSAVKLHLVGESVGISVRLRLPQWLDEEQP